jgi:L-ascorbate metabolism protein UlaG (beta-lactamase superfamily)
MKRAAINSIIGRRDFLKRSGVAAIGASAHSLVGNEVAEFQPATSADVRIQRLSWAGLKLEHEQVTLFIDPWTTTSIWEGAWKQAIVPLEAATSTRHVLITHAHNDHFDAPALRPLLAERGMVVCHEDIAAFVASRGFRVRGVRIYEPLLLGGFTVTAVPALDGLGEPQVSWVVIAGNRKIAHCGDTLWHGSWRHIARQHGPFDAAYLPINGVLLKTQQPHSGIPR